MGMAAEAEGNNLLKGRFGSTAPAAKPATWYLALSLSVPTKNVSTGVIEGITEPVIGGYSRIALTNSDAVWTVDDSQVTLDTPVSWVASATLSGTQPAYWVLYDAASGGNACYAGEITGAINWVSGVTIPVSAITIPLLDA